MAIGISSRSCWRSSNVIGRCTGVNERTQPVTGRHLALPAGAARHRPEGRPRRL